MEGDGLGLVFFSVFSSGLNDREAIKLGEAVHNLKDGIREGERKQERKGNNLGRACRNAWWE